MGLPSSAVFDPVFESMSALELSERMEEEHWATRQQTIPLTINVSESSSPLPSTSPALVDAPLPSARSSENYVDLTNQRSHLQTWLTSCNEFELYSVYEYCIMTFPGFLSDGGTPRTPSRTALENLDCMICGHRFCMHGDEDEDQRT